MTYFPMRKEYPLEDQGTRKIKMIKCLDVNKTKILIMSKEKNTNQKYQEKEYSTLNLGPTHPATHGIFQNVLKMDGEIIVEGESYYWIYSPCI
jgi:hypothetical protein